MTMADLVIWLANRKVTGVLTIERRGVRKDFHVHDGAVVRASSSESREALGQLLVNFGLITEDQLQRAFEVQAETNVLLGRILVMIGLVREDQIVRTLEFHTTETLVDALRWTTGVFILDQRPLPAERPEIEVAVPLIEIHREGARRAAMWKQFDSVFVDPKMTLLVDELRAPPMSPDTLQHRIVSLAKAGLTIEALGMELHAPDYQLYSHLYDLHQRGAIQLRPADHRSNPPPYEIPDFDIDVDTSELENRAREALDGEDYATAYGHAEAAVRSSPGNSVLVDLRTEVEAKLVEEISEALPSTNAIPVLLRTVDQIALARRLNARERYIATRIDGRRSIRSIINVSPMRDIDALLIFSRMVKDGVLRIITPGESL